jgi:hypothetical protein
MKSDKSFNGCFAVALPLAFALAIFEKYWWVIGVTGLVIVAVLVLISQPWRK